MSGHADTSQFESKVVSLPKDEFVALLAKNQRLEERLEAANFNVGTHRQELGRLEAKNQRLREENERLMEEIRFHIAREALAGDTE